MQKLNLLSSYQSDQLIHFKFSIPVIHRDQKPSNVLLDTDCLVKIADFGLARSLTHMPTPDDNSQEPCLTDYVATRHFSSKWLKLAKI